MVQLQWNEIVDHTLENSNAAACPFILILK